MPYVPAGSSCTVPKASTSGGGSHLGEFPFPQILHQDQLPFVLEHSARLRGLTLHSLLPDRSLLCLRLLWHLAGPPPKVLSQALLCLLAVSWLLGVPSLVWPSWLYADNIVNHGHELLPSPSMPTDNKYIITTTVFIGQPLAFIQCNDFVSPMGQLLASLDERSLVCLISIFHTFLSLEHCVPSGLWV